VSVWFYYFHLRHLLVGADACRRKDNVLWRTAMKYIYGRIDAPRADTSADAAASRGCRKTGRGRLLLKCTRGGGLLSSMCILRSSVSLAFIMCAHCIYLNRVRFRVAWEIRCSSCSLTWASVLSEWERHLKPAAAGFFRTRLLLICFFQMCMWWLFVKLKWACGEREIGWLWCP